MSKDFIQPSLLAQLCPPEIASVLLRGDYIQPIAIEEPANLTDRLHFDHHFRNLPPNRENELLSMSPLVNAFFLAIYLIQEAGFSPLNPLFHRDYFTSPTDLDQLFTLLAISFATNGKKEGMHTLLEKVPLLMSEEFMIYGKGAHIRPIAPDEKYKYSHIIIFPRSAPPILYVTIGKAHLNYSRWPNNLLYIAKEAINQTNPCSTGMSKIPVQLERGIVTLVRHGKPNKTDLEPSKTNYVLGFLAENNFEWEQQLPVCESSLNEFFQVASIVLSRFCTTEQSRNLFLRFKHPLPGQDKVKAFSEILELLRKL